MADEILGGKFFSNLFLWLVSSAIGTGIGAYTSLQIMDYRIDANKQNLATHIDWAKEHVNNRNRQIEELKNDLLKNDTAILAKLQKNDERLERVENCVVWEVCGGRKK